jgi:hypothetical protein
VDAQLLVEGLFTTKEPFRLWAVPKQIAEEEREANAVDLHVGQPLRLEISPYRVRLLLDEDTCGNTLARMPDEPAAALGRAQPTRPDCLKSLAEPLKPSLTMTTTPRRSS